MSRLSEINNRYMPYIIWALRVVIGATFIISGLSKMIDVWGFTYKIEQYLGVWGWDITRQLIVIAAMTLSAIEFVMGVLLLTGSYRRSTMWLTSAIMAIMLPLSVYIMIASPVDDCGCFGDFWKISNVSTFLKNIIISGGVLYLWKYNTSAKGVFHNNVQWLVGCVSYVYILVIGFIGYNIQPLIDFRSYKEGSPLVNNVQHDSDAHYNFIYEKNGNEQEFTIDNLPDSTWTFVDRKEIDCDNINDENIYDSFVVTTLDEEDVTGDVITTTNDQLLLLVPEMKYADISYSFLINEMSNYVSNNEGEMIGIFAANDKDKVEKWCDLSLANWAHYIAEDTSIKELARGKMAVVYLKNGIIQWKRTLSSIPSDSFVDSSQSDVLDELYLCGEKQFMKITSIFIGVMVVIYMFNYIISAVKRLFSRKNEKKNVTLQNEKNN